MRNFYPSLSLQTGELAFRDVNEEPQTVRGAAMKFPESFYYAT